MATAQDISRHVQHAITGLVRTWPAWLLLHWARLAPLPLARLLAFRPVAHLAPQQGFVIEAVNRQDTAIKPSTIQNFIKSPSEGAQKNQGA